MTFTRRSIAVYLVASALSINIASAYSDSAEAWPNIPYGQRASGSLARAVALTFDDGPGAADGLQHPTEDVLDVLRAYGLIATFFVCGNASADLRQDQRAQATIRRIVAEGHTLGNHTIDHPRLETLTDDDIADAFRHNEAFIQDSLGHTFVGVFTRAPFGGPFDTASPATLREAPIMAPFGIHVGWGSDSSDWKCIRDGLGPPCIVENIRLELEAGHAGPILMHAIRAETAQALPAVLDMLIERGVPVVTLEEFVRDRYGLEPAEVMDDWRQKNWEATAVGTNALAQSQRDRPFPAPY